MTPMQTQSNDLLQLIETVTELQLAILREATGSRQALYGRAVEVLDGLLNQLKEKTHAN